jgi:hypothetical protein
MADHPESLEDLRRRFPSEAAGEDLLSGTVVVDEAAVGRPGRIRLCRVPDRSTGSLQMTV